MLLKCQGKLEPVREKLRTFCVESLTMHILYCSFISSDIAVARDPLNGNIGLAGVNAITHGVERGVIAYKSHAKGLAVGKDCN